MMGRIGRVNRKECRWINHPGDVHALTFSCDRRRPLLSRDRTRNWLIEAIEEARDRLQFDVWAYVIMPEHVHLVIHPREPEYDISRILWRIKRPVGRKAIAFLRTHATEWMERLARRRSDGTTECRFWQAGGGYDRNLVEEKTIEKVIGYIHRNPVRRGLVERPEDWEWSSARWYAGIRPVVMEIDPTLPRLYE